MSKVVTASHVPLFDRLTGVFESSLDGRLLDAGGLQQSLLLDLARLFNMRNSLTIQQFLESDASVLHYGLPDLLALSPQSEADLQQLQAVLHKGLSLYEPRMSQVLVRITPEPARPYAARANIGAAVALGDQLCRVEFDVSMDAGSFAVGVSA